MRIKNHGKSFRIIGYIIERGINILPSDFLETLKKHAEDSKKWEELKNNKVIEIL